jgi:hypothetical protein
MKSECGSGKKKIKEKFQLAIRHLPSSLIPYVSTLGPLSLAYILSPLSSGLSPLSSGLSPLAFGLSPYFFNDSLPIQVPASV